MRGAITAAPCAKCPFRKDVPIYLRTERRREIAHSLANGQTFHCHAEVDYDTEDEFGEVEPDTSHARMCAGAAKALLLDGATTNFMRVMERIGSADLDRTADTGPEVWGLIDWQELAEGATGDNPVQDDEEVLTCCTVNAGCLAPAGFAGHGGAISLGTEPADGECTLCGEPLCSNCADSHGRCGMCTEEDEDE